MCPKASPIHAIDEIWLRLRRPFRYPPAGHSCSWERFDADRAGCVLCGRLHKCSGSLVGCDCPLVETDEGGHVCLVTGLCIAEVRASSDEFMPHVTYDQPREPRASEGDGIHERVNSIVRTFLNAPSTAACRRQEQKKSTQRVRQAFGRILKQRKRDHPYALPCLCSVVAEVAHAEQMQQFQCKLQLDRLPTYTHLLDQVVSTCSDNIATGMLQIHRLGFRKICQGGKFHNMVVGMLYMSRTGLHVGSLFHLPAVRNVHELLPSETYLNSLGVSNKVICDTENEIKSCIRAFTDGVLLESCDSLKALNSAIKGSPSHSLSVDNHRNRSRIQSRCGHNKCGRAACLTTRPAPAFASSVYSLPPALSS